MGGVFLQLDALEELRHDLLFLVVLQRAHDLKQVASRLGEEHLLGIQAHEDQKVRRVPGKSGIRFSPLVSLAQYTHIDVFDKSGNAGIEVLTVEHPVGTSKRAVLPARAVPVKRGRFPAREVPGKRGVFPACAVPGKRSRRPACGRFARGGREQLVQDPPRDPNEGGHAFPGRIPMAVCAPVVQGACGRAVF